MVKIAEQKRKGKVAKSLEGLRVEMRESSMELVNDIQLSSFHSNPTYPFEPRRDYRVLQRPTYTAL